MKKSLPIINTGLRLDIKENDDIWMAGKKSGKNLSGIIYEVINESGDWLLYNQKHETQKPFGIDWMDCTAEGFMETIGQQVNFFIENGIIDHKPIKDWLDNTGKFNGSERELAEVSGNTVNGNSMQNVMEAGRLKGIAPESYNPRPTSSINWANYHSNSTAKSKAKALEFLNYFEIKYEKLPTQSFLGRTTRHDVMQYHLKQAPLYAGAGTCPGWFSQKIIAYCSMAANHAFNIAKDNGLVHIVDSYPPWIRKLSAMYPIPHVYKVLLIPKDNIKIMKSTIYTTAEKRPAMYEKWEDGKFRLIPYGDYVGNRYDWKKVEIIELLKIEESNIVGTVAEVEWVIKRINQQFGMELKAGDITKDKIEQPINKEDPWTTLRNLIKKIWN